MQHEGALRVVAGDYADDAALLASLGALRADLDELEVLLAEPRRHAHELPHRTRYLRLVDSLGRRMIEAQREWLAEVEAELGSDAGPAPARGVAAGRVL